MKPTKKEIGKVLFAVFITIIAVFFAFGFTAFNADIINKIVAAFTALSALWLWLLDNSNMVFLTWNSIKMRYFLRDTVAWKATYVFNVDVCFDFEKYCKEYIKQLNSKKVIASVIKQTATRIIIELHDGKKQQLLKIFLSDKDDVFQIRFVQSASMAYKDSKSEYMYFQSLIEKFKKYISQVDGKSYFLGRDELFTVSLQFKKNNPFYHLTVKHVDNVDIEKFDLKFNDGNVEVKISKNSITLISEEKDDIALALKNYIAISEHN